MAQAWRLGVLEDAGAALFGLLVLLWLVVAGRTLRAAQTGEVWAPRLRPRTAPAAAPAPAA